MSIKRVYFIEHVLVKSTEFPGHFALNHPGGYDISTGTSIELFYDDDVPLWHEGRVEYAREHGGYFFESDDRKKVVPLQEGMIVRIPPPRREDEDEDE
jgi:hypothetical protein